MNRDNIKLWIVLLLILNVFIPPMLAETSGQTLSVSWSIKDVEDVRDFSENDGRVSISVDDNYYPHLSYKDGHTHANLSYAQWTGSSWDIQLVDTSERTGYYSDIDLDNSGYPHISYYDAIDGDLKYAQWTGSSWNVQIIDSTNDVGTHTSIVIDENDLPHISYCYGTGADLKYAQWTGSSWNITTVDASGDVGSFTSIDIDSNGKPHISYRDFSNDDLKYSYWDSGTWNIQTVDSTGDVGRDSEIDIDYNDNIHIVYYDRTNYDLKYAYYNGNSWDIQTIDSTGNVGYSCSISIDENNFPKIGYVDGTTPAVKYSYWDGSTWKFENVNEIECDGVSIDVNNRNIGFGYYDLSTTTVTVKYANGTFETIPSYPTNLKGNSGNKYINISWDPPSDDGGDTITEYNIYRSESSNNETWLDTINSPTTWYNDTSVNNDITYYYYVTCSNSHGESDPSEEISGTPMAPATNPSPPINLNSVKGDEFINLTWEEPTHDGNRSITEYKIFRSLTVDDVKNHISTVSHPDMYYNDTNLDNGVEYFYNIIAVNNASLESEPSENISAVPMTTPMPPVNIVTSAGDGYINLSWDEPTNDGGSNISGYNIYKSSDQSAMILIDTVDSIFTYYNDTYVTNGVTYSYNLTSLNEVGESGFSNKIDSTSMTFPSSTRYLQSSYGYDYVNISWSEPSDDGGSSIIEYNIYRGISSDNLDLINTVDSLRLYYNDTDVNEGGNYYYSVSATNEKGEGKASSVLEVATLSDEYTITVGPVKDANNKFVEGAYVTVSYTNPENFDSIENSGVTDSNGVYEFNVDFNPDDVIFYYDIEHDGLDRVISNSFYGDDTGGNSGPIETDIGAVENDETEGWFGNYLCYGIIILFIILGAILAINFSKGTLKDEPTFDEEEPWEWEEEEPLFEEEEEEEPWDVEEEPLFEEELFEDGTSEENYYSNGGTIDNKIDAFRKEVNEFVRLVKGGDKTDDKIIEKRAKIDDMWNELDEENLSEKDRKELNEIFWKVFNYDK